MHHALAYHHRHLEIDCTLNHPTYLCLHYKLCCHHCKGSYGTARCSSVMFCPHMQWRGMLLLLIFHKLIPMCSLLKTDVYACHLNSPKDNQQVRDKIKSFCCQSCFYLSLVVRSCTFLSRYSRRNSTTHNRWLTKLIISPTIKYRVSPLGTCVGRCSNHAFSGLSIQKSVENYCDFHTTYLTLLHLRHQNAMFCKAISKRGSHRGMTF